jgi:hypothetical protein
VYRGFAPLSWIQTKAWLDASFNHISAFLVAYSSTQHNWADYDDISAKNAALTRRIQNIFRPIPLPKAG